MEQKVKKLEEQIENFFFHLYRETREGRYRYSLNNSSFTTAMSFYCFRNISNFNNIIVRVKSIDKAWPEQEYDVIGHNESDRLLFVPIVVKYLKDYYFAYGGKDINFEPKVIQENT